MICCGVAYNGHLSEHLQVIALGYCGLCLEISRFRLAEAGDSVQLDGISYLAWRVLLSLRYRVWT